MFYTITWDREQIDPLTYLENRIDEIEENIVEDQANGCPKVETYPMELSTTEAGDVSMGVVMKITKDRRWN